MRDVVKLSRSDLRKIIQETVALRGHPRGALRETHAGDVVDGFVSAASTAWKQGFNADDVSMDGMDQDAWSDEVERATLELGERVREVFDEISARLTAGEFA